MACGHSRLDQIVLDGEPVTDNQYGVVFGDERLDRGFVFLIERVSGEDVGGCFLTGPASAGFARTFVAASRIQGRFTTLPQAEDAIAQAVLEAKPLADAVTAAQKAVQDAECALREAREKRRSGMAATIGRIAADVVQPA